MKKSTRLVQSLNGRWEFAYLGPIELGEFDPKAERKTEAVWVPSAFDAFPDHAGKRGAAVYRTRFEAPAGGRVRLEFGAVSMWCRVYVNGEKLKEHACGYAPFTVDVPGVEGGEQELTVLVDNRYDFERVPMHEEYFDFYQYGGILREVTWAVLPAQGAWVDYAHVLPGEAYREGAVEIRVGLGGETEATVDLEVAFDGGEPTRHAGVAVVDGVATVAARVPGPRVWAPETPELHGATVGVAGGEAVAVRFGLRKIEARDGQLWLNGERLRLRGYNRHEWHPNAGPCTPLIQQFADLKLMKDLGCNFIRGSHYPQDQRFLDLCDELGFLVWEENLGWGQREKTFKSGKFLRDHAESLRAMVRLSANHPSVIIWGFLNEAGTDKAYVRPCIEDTVATLRKLDPTRLISYATMFPERDLCFDLVDLISINLYPGWYGCEGVEDPLSLIKPTWDRVFASVDARGFGGKPIMISETGVEGLYGWRDPHDGFFTEEYQAEYLRRAITWAVENPRCCGIALWHFSDARTYAGGLSLKRPRAFNNKGTLDEYRRPKQAYQVVKALFGAAAGGTGGAERE